MFDEDDVFITRFAVAVTVLFATILVVLLAGMALNDDDGERLPPLDTTTPATPLGTTPLGAPVGTLERLEHAAP